MERITVIILFAAIIITSTAFRVYIAEKDRNSLNKKQKSVLKRIIISSVIALVLQFVDVSVFQSVDLYTFTYMGRILRFIAYATAYIIIGYDILEEAFESIRDLKVLDENCLMVVATLGALSIAVYENSDYTEAIAVMILYQLGELFQGYAVGKSRRNISELMDMRTDYANIEKNGKLHRVAPEKVKTGTVIVVLPGEKVAIDGIVEEGESTINTSALTGESLPRDVAAGDEIISGCVNMTGVLKIRTTKEFGESTVSKILKLVEDSSAKKSKSESVISEFARYYTPAVCLGALALAVLPPVFRMVFLNTSADFGIWIYRALTFLVISCPCALVISIPLTFFAGIGGAGKAGILIKGSDYMETLAAAKTVVFDKTGTLTKGVFEVSEIICDKSEKEDLLYYAAYAEASSSHPIAKSILCAYGKEIDRNLIESVEELGGYGVVARVNGDTVAAGNDKLMRKLNIEFDGYESSDTVVHISVNNKYKGLIVVSDTVKENSEKALRLLKKSGITKTVMLSGDNKSSAEKIGTQIGINEIHSGLMPADKVRIIDELLKQKTKNEKLAFVGDGINDAPALTAADVGVAMGAMGSDAAIEAADVVLMDDDPVKIVSAIRISRKCLSIAYQNITFALGVKTVCLLLGAFGIANMWFAVFADVGVMVIAVLNAVRALNTRFLNK